MFGPDGPGLLELARQALSSTRGGYDQLAPRFDATPFRTPDPLLERVMARVGHARRGLDVCCGTGAALGHLRGVCDEVVGVDFSQGMLDEARRRLGPDVALVRADARALPFRGGFDLATCFGALGHFVPQEQPALLSSIFRALEPGGRFVTVSGERPGPTRAAFWASHGFNGVMRIRNRLWKPEFVMYYLTFALPDAVARLVEAGFSVEVSPLDWPDRPDLVLVVATRPT